jgi:Mrp family chromosome partitioning ATPase
MITRAQIYQALRRVIDPELRCNLVESGMIRDVTISDGQVNFVLALTTLACPLKDQLVAEARQAVSKLAGVEVVNIDLAEMTVAEKRQLFRAAAEPAQVVHHHIRHIIAVLSGKGGVGKSLISGLLAIALRLSGYRVGLLDADITGSSIPKILFPKRVRLGASPVATLPSETRTGIKVMSINLLQKNEDQAIIWRGPLISRAIQQFWRDVRWNILDYLVVDLPPGTSDAALTVMQCLPLSGVVLVTSPQDLAGMVVRKTAQMARQLQVPILGLVENMSTFVCPDTGRQYNIFGPSKAEEMAASLDVTFLGRLPIDPKIAELCDVGRLEEYPVGKYAFIAKQLVEITQMASEMGEEKVSS